MKGITSTGFGYEISENIKNDYELLELIAKVDSNPILIPQVVDKILGEDQKRKLFEHVRKDGIVQSDRIMEEIGEIFKNESIKN